MLRLDVFVQGVGVKRGTEVERLDDGIRFGERTIPWRDILWVSRRAGMMLVFTNRSNIAVQATGHELSKLEGWLDRGVDQTELRRRLVRQIGHEVVLFSAGCAVDGTFGGTKLRGLYLAAATRRALYLLSGSGQYTMEWPVDRVKRQLARPGEVGGDGLLLAKGEDELLLRYLFPEEVVSLATACRKQPPPRTGAGPALELFSRREVSPPPPAALPEFSEAAGALHDVARRAAANVPGEQMSLVGLTPDFFEDHFLELGELALGPLILRKSAASRAESLRKATEAMNAEGLQEDTRAAVAAAADRLIDVYTGIALRLADARGVQLEGKLEDAPRTVELRQRLAERMQAPFDNLWARFEGLDVQVDDLIEVLDRFEDGPPGEDDGLVEESATEWRATLGRLDAGYVGAWRELVEEIEATWSNDLLPRLVQITTQERRGMPEWVQLAVLGVVTLAIVVALVVLFVV